VWAKKTNATEEAPQPPTPPPVNQTPAEPVSPWQYDDDELPPTVPVDDIPQVEWNASEFVDHQKTAAWFLGLGVVVLVVSIVIYLVIHDWITVIVIAFAALLFGITAARKPRTLQYQLDDAGVQIGTKFYEYELFKSFSIQEEGVFSSILLLPLKRFMPPLSLYFPPEQEDKIMDVLGSFLPHEEHTHDPIDRLMRKIRF